MQAHVAKTVSNCFGVLRQIRSIRRSVTKPVLQSLVVSMVLTRLDYGSATLAGLPNTLLNRLQSVLHAAARLIYSARKYDHVTPLLRDLHWLRVPERIAYRLAVLAFRCQHGTAPSYLSAELSRVADDDSRRRLRSAHTAALDMSFPDRSTRRSVTARFQLRRHASGTVCHLFRLVVSITASIQAETELFTRSYPAAEY
jgi:hypothetical protein